MWKEAEKQYSPTIIPKESPSMVTSKGTTPFKGPNRSISLKSSPGEQRAG